MPKPLFPQPSLSIYQQIEWLKKKKFIIGNESEAQKWLSYISYFRFKNYSYPFKDYKNCDGDYIQNTSFKDIMNLYRFDTRLRLIIFEAIENIEVSIKTQISNNMSTSYGAHWYTNIKHFNNSGTFDHNEFLARIEKDCRNPEEIFLKHYVDHYDPPFPPSWMLMEILTFGSVSKLFEALAPCQEKIIIQNNFNLTKMQLTSWLHTFTYIRNRCVHHSRLVYKKMQFTPAMPVKRSRQFLQESELVSANSLYAVLSCIQYILASCNPSSLFKKNLRELINSNKEIDCSRLGFTLNWKEDPFWN